MVGRSSTTAITIGATIGSGGMGIVREATQLSLGRRVAVKMVLPNACESASERALQEAWVTGFLEHPGVVPVHDLAEDGDGSPIVVMRRIEGKTWRACLGDPAWAEAAGARDLLEQNLRVLLRVCEVVEFAHAKGVLHRDIKPTNVMIGSFGEVYLLDWGLAVALHGEAVWHLPSAELRDVAGSFAYAAPEMVGLLDLSLTERTDVYLLGAVLFEIATGRRPHMRTFDGPPLGSIDASPPPLPASVAPRLAAIIRKAMARLPRDRHASASAFRQDVLAYLRARDSDHLVTSAEQLLAALVDASASGASARRVEELHAECRFAFREALARCPENEAARRGLDVLSAVMIERELACDPTRALALVEENERMSPELVARVRLASATQRDEQARLARLSRDNDHHCGGIARRNVFVCLGLSWALSTALAASVGPQTHTRYAVAALFELVLLVVLCGAVRALTQTHYNRRVMTAMALLFVSVFALYVAGARFGVSVATLRTAQIGLWSLTVAQLASTMERRLWPAALTLAAAFGVAAAAPGYQTVAAAVAMVFVTASVATIGSPRIMDSQAASGSQAGGVLGMRRSVHAPESRS